MKKALWISLLSTFGVLTVVGAVGNVICQSYRPQINSLLKISRDSAELNEDIKYFTSEFESVEKQVEEEGKLCTELEAEGAVLLKNENKALPLAKTDKISLFSTSSVDPIYGGTGSGQVSANDAVNLRSAINSTFGAGTVNVELFKRYLVDLSSYRRVNAGTTGGTIDQYRIGEAPWNEVMTSDIEATLPDFPNAIVVLSRSGGEGNDLPITECANGENGNYLVLNKEEKDMLAGLKAYKDAGKINKIIVLLNGSNALQLDFLDKSEYDIDAAAWIGGVGTTGMTAVAELLCGQRNFSGRLSDTFLKDNLSGPTIANFGLHAFANSSAGSREYNTGWAQNNTDAGIELCNENYIVYQEGIYIGYRYYETRYADLVMNQGNTTGYDYHKDVAYPFGYGDSYTTWSYSGFSIEDKGEVIEATVKITNSGSFKGKHAAEIYVAPTYTDYDKTNHVEKSAIVLGGFAKTKELGAGESETLTIPVKKRDLASYDTEGKKTFILDGDYHFTIGHNAHEANNNVLTKLGFGSSVDAVGDETLVATYHVEGVDDVTASKSEETGYKITNAFDHADLNRYEGTADQKITYLTRSNWNATFPSTLVSLKINEAMWRDGLDYSVQARDLRVAKMKEKYYPELLNAALPEMGKSLDNKITTVMMRNVHDLDDPKWAEFISQANYDEMTNLIYNGFHVTEPVASLTLPSTKDENGPQGFTASLIGGGEGAHGMAYTSEDVMASTRNVDLLRRMGECIGEDCLNAKYAGLYGPGSNIHRNPYCGRNFEYYSEDPILSSRMQEKEVAGIQSKGVYVFTKHFALNDQESGRYGLSTWANEQSIRELYLKAFEGTALGGGMGVMSSFNRMGVIWAGSDYSLMTTVLRKEWGVKGAAITDCSVMATFMDVASGVLAGQDLWDGSCKKGDKMATLDKYANDPVVTRAVQTATKHIAYSVSHSLAMNGYDDGTSIQVSEEWYLVATRWLAIVSGVIAAGSLAMLIVTIVQNRKKKLAA